MNPLTVAVNKHGKKRLVLDSRHINLSLFKYKFRMEDAQIARYMFKRGDFAILFDLISAYHHISIFPQHRKFLGFYWDSKYFVFDVLPFGVSTAAYIFTKVMRHLVEVWRSQGIRIIMYLDDGIAVSSDYFTTQKKCQTKYERIYSILALWLLKKSQIGSQKQ